MVGKFCVLVFIFFGFWSNYGFAATGQYSRLDVVELKSKTAQHAKPVTVGLKPKTLPAKKYGLVLSSAQYNAESGKIVLAAIYPKSHQGIAKTDEFKVDVMIDGKDYIVFLKQIFSLKEEKIMTNKGKILAKEKTDVLATKLSGIFSGN